MAVSRSSALANTYLIPQQAPQPVAQRPQFQDEVGDPLEGLQQVDGVTSQYFDKWAALKGFARDVWENYGIDVRYPDPSVPESNRLHRIYLKSIADLKAQGAKLKTSQSMYNAALQRGDIIRKDPRTQAFSDFQPGTDVVSKTLDPIVTQVNDKLQQQYYDAKSLKEAQEIYETTKQQFIQSAEEDPGNREYWLRQVTALTPPTSAAKQFAPPRENAASERDRRKTAGAIAFLKERTNLLSGTHDSYKLSNDVFGPNGERVMVSKSTAGEIYEGDKVVEMRYLPQSGQSIIVVKDKDGNIASKDVTGINPMAFAKQTTSDNAKYAATGAELDIAADEAGLFTETGEVDPTPLLAPDTQARYAKMQKEIEADAGTSFKLKQLKDELNSLESSFFHDDRVTKVGSDGIPIKIARRKDGYQIENIKSLVSSKEYLKNKAKYKAMSERALINFLTKRGVLQGQEVEQPTSAPQETEAQRLLREHRARKASGN